jgi:hypothetical protein
MELKTIEGVYSIAGVGLDGSSLCKYMEKREYFIAVVLIKK